MRLGIRIAIVLVIIACCAMLVGLGRVSREQSGGAARFFIPGELGRELRLVPRGGRPANEPDAASPGFLTRAFSGLRGKEGAEWGRQNGLTRSLSFSHNLTHVFPPELFREKPEFFPLVEGKRLEPPKGSYFWNPDIAREDAAIHAAGVARKHFEAHPDDVSFALGVNDALVWGESPELLALLGGQWPMANGKSPKPDGKSQAASGETRMANGKGQVAHGQGAMAPPPPNNWFRGRPDYSNVVFTFMNRAAAELSRTHPDKHLGALAYYWCENVPDFPLHPQVVPFLTADRSQGYDPAFWQQEMDLQTKWGRLSEARRQMTDDRRRMLDAGGQTPEGGRQLPDVRSQASGVGRLASDFRPPAPGVRAKRRLGIYDYLYGAGFIVPRVHTRLMAGHLRHAGRAGFTDYYAEVNPNWGLDGPMPWLTAQLLQNPEQSREALLDEYYERYFQHAAEPMRRFFEKCEQQWMAQKPPSYWLKHFRNESQAALFPPHIRGALRMHLTAAEVMAGSRKVLERVRLVSDAFGVTERFCDFNEARVALALMLTDGKWQMANGKRRMADGGWPMAGGGRTGVGTDFPTGDEPLKRALASYLDARREYIRHAVAVRHGQRLALHPVNHDDFLRNNPGFAAAVRLLEASAGDARVADALRRRPESWLHAAADFHEARAAGHVRELLPAGSLEGPQVPGRRIAGLQYGVDLPGPWQSRLEPTETHEAAVTTSAARTGAAGLRISGAVNSTVYQWVPVTGGRTVVVSGFARARVSPSNAVTLTLGWLDAQHRPVGAVVVVRIPDGEWPDWLQLMQGARAPANAAWAGLGIRVQNQVRGDWVEFDDLSMVEIVDR